MQLSDVPAIAARAQRANILADEIRQLRDMRSHIADGGPFEINTCGDKADGPHTFISSRNSYTGTRFLHACTPSMTMQILLAEIEARLKELEAL